MVFPGILRRVALLRIEVPEELSASIFRVTRIDELGTTLAVTSNRRTLRRNTWYFYFVVYKILLRSVRLLLVTASVVPSSLILVNLMKEALRSSETENSIWSPALQALDTGVTALGSPSSTWKMVA
jgi:hypothetical protein